MIILIILSVATGCTKKNIIAPPPVTNPPPVVQETDTVYSLFPISIGNYWIYLNSHWSYQDSVLSSGFSIDTIMVVSSKKDSAGLVWWHLNKSSLMGLIPQDFTIRNDSIFCLQTTYIGNRQILTLALPPPRRKPFTFYILHGDIEPGYNVALGETTCTVPAGTFTLWASYVLPPGFGTDSIVMAPGVGFISETYNGLSPVNLWPYKKTSVLLEYSIK